MLFYFRRISRAVFRSDQKSLFAARNDFTSGTVVTKRRVSNATNFGHKQYSVGFAENSKAADSRSGVWNAFVELRVYSRRLICEKFGGRV